VALRQRLRRRLASEARRAAGVLLRVAQQVESPRGSDQHDDGRAVDERSGGPPEHWLAVVRARAPQLLEGRGIGVHSGASPATPSGRALPPIADTSTDGGWASSAGVPGVGPTASLPAPAPWAPRERPAPDRTTRASPRWATPAPAAPDGAAASWPVASVPPAPVATYADANGTRATSGAWPEVPRPSPWPALERWPVVAPAAAASPGSDAPADRPAATTHPAFPPSLAPVPPTLQWSTLGPTPAPVRGAPSSTSPGPLPDPSLRIEQAIAAPSGPPVDLHDSVTGPWPSLPSVADDDAPAPTTAFDRPRIDRLDAEQQGH